MSIQNTLAAHIVCIDHIGIAVADLEEALVFYTELLGCTVIHRERNDEQLIEEVMLSTREAGSQIQLLAATSQESTIASFISKHGPGLQQLAYRVTDIDAACAAAKAAGLRLVYDSPRRGTLNSRINFIHPRDAGGVLIELVQPAN